MTINSEFGQILVDSGLNEHILASKLDVSTVEVNMIKNQTLYPNFQLAQSILELRDQTAQIPAYEMASKFQRGQHVGNKVNFTRTAFAIVFIIFISAMMTGFGYQPMGIFLLILFAGLFLTLPACFESYWIIHTDGLTKVTFSNYDFIKFLQLLGIIKKQTQIIDYSKIKCAAITYHNRNRISPFDVQPDYFKLNLTLDDQSTVELGIDQRLVPELSSFVELLNHQGINVYDRQKVLVTIDKGENLFEHYNVIYN